VQADGGVIDPAVVAVDLRAVSPHPVGRWLVGLVVGLGLPVAVIAVMVVNAVGYAWDLTQEILHRPTPPIGWYTLPTAGEAVFTTIWGLAMATAAAAPALLVIRRLGRRHGVDGWAVLTCALPWVAVAGYLAAVLVHATWNLVSTEVAARILPSFLTADRASPVVFFTVGSVTSVVLLAIPTAVLVAWRRGARVGPGQPGPDALETSSPSSAAAAEITGPPRESLDSAYTDPAPMWSPPRVSTEIVAPPWPGAPGRSPSSGPVIATTADEAASSAPTSSPITGSGASQTTPAPE